MNGLPCGRREECTGCAACAAACADKCITMERDGEGFLLPKIDAGRCHDCGLCLRTCPVGGSAGVLPESGPAVWAGWHRDEAVRAASSSGGVFTALADTVMRQGGVVVGAALSGDLRVRHCLVTDRGDLRCLRGSKYVQSEIPPELLHMVCHRLQAGQKVLFSGTPCEVAGLRQYLRIPYPQLVTCDLVCHGVPSPLVFVKYLAHCEESGGRIVAVEFRDKTKGWKRTGIRLSHAGGSSRLATLDRDPYSLAFLRNYNQRECCYRCRFANLRRPGDLTLGDYWGVGQRYPEYDREDRGTSLILANTVKGRALLSEAGSELILGTADLASALAGNPNLRQPSGRPPERDEFYRDLDALTFHQLVRKYRLRPRLNWRRYASGLTRRLGGLVRRLGRKG